MAINVVHYEHQGRAAWGVLRGARVTPVPGDFATTGEFIGANSVGALVALHGGELEIPSVRVLSPVTRNQQFLCQGVNYASHVRESGLDPSDFPFNTIFTKAPSCLSGPYDDVVKPAHVRLLDYEVELGVVLGCDLHESTTVHPDRLHEVLAGVTIVNDVSARCVQLPQMQFYKGKSYRTFGPTGPLLLLLEADEWQRWPELHMRLTVNGQVRQEAYCGEMLHKPHQTLSELSGVHHLHAGDLVATGTPAGCAARAPGRLVMFITRHFLSDATKWKLFIKGNLRNPAYLQPNDVMELSIRTDDGQLDLGMQRTRVVAG